MTQEVTSAMTSGTERAEHRWVSDAAGLEEVARAVEAAPWCAIDTESNSMHAYRERVCLLQINAAGRLFMVDTLALPTGPGALGGLAELLAGDARRVFVHGGEYDVAVLKREYDLALGGLFDTQQAASLLGWERTGYGALVEAICGVSLPKHLSQYDWATRPLADDALLYALDDVIHLPEVARVLMERVREADLEEEVAIANRAVEETGAHEAGFDPAGMWRLKGLRELPKRALPMLTALYAWRDEQARALDVPPGRLLANAALLALAERPPMTQEALGRKRLPGRLRGALAQDLLRVVNEAAAAPPEPPPRPVGREVGPEEREREARLKEWRRQEAERRGVTLQVVLPARALEHLKRCGADDLEAVPQLGDKRIRLYGDALRRLVG